MSGNPTNRELAWKCYNRARDDASIGLKTLVLRSLLIALIFGPLTTFAYTVLSVRGPIKYDPPISEAEWRQLTELPAAKMALALQGREVHLTRSQWLASSVGHSFFWLDLMKNSVVPVLGVFSASVCLGYWQRRTFAVYSSGGPSES